MTDRDGLEVAGPVRRNARPDHLAELRREVDSLEDNGPTADVSLGQIVADAGAEDFLAFASGRVGGSSIADIRSHRIVCLLSNGLPLSEADRLVARLFRVTTAAARRLIVGAAARFPGEFKDMMRAEATRVLSDPRWESEEHRWHVLLRPGLTRDFVIEIAKDSGHANPRAAGIGYLVAFSTGSVNAVRAELGLAPVEEPS